MFTYLYPLQARFINPLRRTIKNAMLMCIAHLPYTALFLAIDAVIYFIATRSVYSLATTIFVGCIGGMAGLAFIQCVFFRKIFSRYEPDEGEENSGFDAAPIDSAKTESLADTADMNTFPQDDQK